MFVFKGEIAFNGHAAELAKQHARKREPVVHFGKRHFSLVQFHAHRKSVSFCCHSLLNHLLHVVVKMFKQIHVAFSEFLFVGKRNHTPICLVHFEHHLLRPAAMFFLGYLFGIVGNFVVCADFSAHIQRLRNGECAGKHVSSVGFEAFVYFLSHVRKFVNHVVAEFVKRIGQFGVVFFHNLSHRGERLCYRRTEIVQFVACGIVKQMCFTAVAKICSRCL